MRRSQIVSMLVDARHRTLELMADLSDEQMGVPLLSIINPPIWEVGHVGWFQERWTMRRRGEPSIRPDADALWDSAAVAHDTRWGLPLPTRRETLQYLDDVLDRVIEGLPRDQVSGEQAYFPWLAAMHEDMHGEAFTYTRQTLGYPAPRLAAGPAAAADSAPPPAGDVEIAGGAFSLGALPDGSLVFDNEKWAHPAEVAPFALARSAVTNGQFAAFVDDGGYRRREWWSEEGWQWREKAAAEHPVYWIRQAGGGWMRRHFDQVVALGEDIAMIHVNWHEADAYCRWGHRRLPTEAEWEMAASWDPRAGAKRSFPWGQGPPSADRAFLDARRIGCGPAGALAAGDSAAGCRQMIGNAWEWTTTTFGPYPGFVIDPYKEYSAPWFGEPYKVLRGGCWATRSRLIRNTWRNFYTKDRRDVFAGFRTCRR